MKAERFSYAKLPKLKGHVKIELKDIKTNKTETAFEGDNLITNAVSDIFASNYGGALDYRKLLPLYSKMFGGILLFTNQLDVSSADAAKDYYIPDNSANTVIAHAGQTGFTSQADDMTRGIPLDSAMHITDGAVTLAWEWGASAGTGTIKSVALTHADVGDAGTGSNSVAFAALKPTINANFGLALNTSSNLENMIMFVGNDGYGYRFTTNGTSVTIVKIPMAYKKTGLVGNIFVDACVDTHVVTVATNYGTNRPDFCYDDINHKLWLFYNTSSSKVVKVEEINLSTWTATNHDSDFDDLDVNVGPLYVGSGTMSVEAPYQNGFAYLRKGSNSYNVTGLLKVQLSNTANQTDLTCSTIAIGGCFKPSSTGKVFAGKKFVINNDVLYNCTSDTPDLFWDNLQTMPFMCSRTGLANLGGQFNAVSAGQYYVAISKFYLATKFNLPETIVKQNTQSMTVTYTLTEVSS